MDFFEILCNERGKEKMEIFLIFFLKNYYLGKMGYFGPKNDMP